MSGTARVATGGSPRTGPRSRWIAGLAGLVLVAGAGMLGGCRTAGRPYVPDVARITKVPGVEFWDVTLVDATVPYDPSQPVRIGHLGVAGSVRVLGLRPIGRSVVDGLAAGAGDLARGLEGGPGVSVPTTPLPPATVPDDGLPTVGRMTITAQVRLSARTIAEAERRVRGAQVTVVSELDAQEVRLVAPGLPGVIDRVNYEITLDHPTALQVRTRRGDVVVRRMAGDLDVLTREGDVEVDAHGGLGRPGTFVRAISGRGDVDVDAATDAMAVVAEEGRASVDWTLGRQPAVLDVVSRDRPALPATTRYSPNVRVTIGDEDDRVLWRDEVSAAWARVPAPGPAGE